MSISFCRPASMRVVHQVAPAVEISDTRSPSRVPFSRKLATATFAWFARKGVMCMSSKTTTKVRARCSSGAVFEDTFGGGGAAADGCSGSSTASKVTTSCFTPSSVTVRSAAVRPLIGVPFLSVTTTSTITCSSWVGKVGVSAGAGAGPGPGPERPASPAVASRPRPGQPAPPAVASRCPRPAASPARAGWLRAPAPAALERPIVCSSSAHPTFTKTCPPSILTSKRSTFSSGFTTFSPVVTSKV